MKENFKEHKPVVVDKDSIHYTCESCSLRDKCRWAFDGYCTDGDCIMDK